MKKITCLLWTLLSASFAHSQITIQLTVKGYGNKIGIDYWKDFTFINDTLLLNGNKANLTLDSKVPVYFNLETITPFSYTPFLMALPGETIAIEKDSNHLTIKGGVESYNTFLLKVDSGMRRSFTEKHPDHNTMTKYLLDRSEEFFSSFSHPDKQMIKDNYTLSVITNHKLYPLLVKYSNDTSKMNSLFYLIKNPGTIVPNDDEVLKYIDKVNFNNPDIGFANMPEIMMMNNFIRVLRMQAVTKDSTLENVDEYVIENKIIKSLFKEGRYRSRLLAYNLYFRINAYTQFPMQLAGMSDFIADFRKEKFNDGLLSPIEKVYDSQLSTIGSLAKGAIAPAFKLPDAKGKPVLLSDFKGKVVYLDIWASWCGPCLKEMPYMEALKKKFSNKAVEIVAISIDTDTDRWLAKIASMKLGGIQLIDNKGSQNSRIARDYKIQGVPHFVLIDKNGRIASAFAPRPSSETEIEKEINQLL